MTDENETLYQIVSKMCSEALRVQHFKNWPLLHCYWIFLSFLSDHCPIAFSRYPDISHVSSISNVLSFIGENFSQKIWLQQPLYGSENNYL